MVAVGPKAKIIKAPVGINSFALFNMSSYLSKAFFAGDKTAKETAEVLQSRVKIYVSENS